MSGIIGHVTYAILAAKAAAHRRLPLEVITRRHFASYLAGAYLGCDIQTMPEAICVDTGREVGYGTVPLEKSPLTGGKVRTFHLAFEGRQYTPYEIHALFYGRSHLTFGWDKAQQDLTLPWQHLPEYCSAVAEDAIGLFGPAQRPLAYVLGWMTHLVGDGLIKSIWPGVTLNLLDGKYTRRNRPVQDLFTFHEVGRKELGVHWPALLADLAETPVEPIQLHYMRCAAPRGRLAQDFHDGWAGEHEGLLRAVLAENRRYLRIYNRQVLEEMQLTQTPTGWQCRAALQEMAGGLTYAQMVEAAEKADFRHALWQIGQAIADLFEQVAQLVPSFQDLSGDDGPTWEDLTQRWRK